MKKYFESFKHRCELNVEEGIEGFLKNKHWLRQSFIKWTTIDPTSELTLQHFNSYSAFANGRKFHLENYPLTIHPFSQFKLVWEIIMMLVLLCGLILDPLHFLDYFKEGHVISGVISSDFLASVRASVKIVCILDMAARFFMGFVDERNSTVSSCEPQLLFWQNSSDNQHSRTFVAFLHGIPAGFQTFRQLLLIK